MSSKPTSKPDLVPATADTTPNDVVLHSVREFLSKNKTGRYMKIALKDGAGANTIEVEISDPK